MTERTPTVRTASTATRQFFQYLDTAGISQSEISDRSGIHVNTFYGWKTGKAAATVFNMEAALAVMGLELIIQPITTPNQET
jgi:hypothetical protein